MNRLSLAIAQIGLGCGLAIWMIASKIRDPDLLRFEQRTNGNRLGARVDIFENGYGTD